MPTGQVRVQSDSESLSCSPFSGWLSTVAANGSDGERRHSCEARLVSVFESVVDRQTA